MRFEETVGGTLNGSMSGPQPEERRGQHKRKEQRDGKLGQRRPRERGGRRQLGHGQRALGQHRRLEP